MAIFFHELKLPKDMHTYATEKLLKIYFLWKQNSVTKNLTNPFISCKKYTHRLVFWYVTDFIYLF